MGRTQRKMDGEDLEESEEDWGQAEFTQRFRPRDLHYS